MAVERSQLSLYEVLGCISAAMEAEWGYALRGCRPGLEKKQK